VKLVLLREMHAISIPPKLEKQFKAPAKLRLTFYNFNKQPRYTFLKRVTGKLSGINRASHSSTAPHGAGVL
jgi:hypothetical protein